jgi:hypothetical protein
VILSGLEYVTFPTLQVGMLYPSELMEIILVLKKPSEIEWL